MESFWHLTYGETALLLPAKASSLRAEKIIMNILRSIQRYVNPFESKTEDLLISCYQWWLEKQHHNEIRNHYKDTKLCLDSDGFINVIGVGIKKQAEGKSIIYSKGFLETSIRPEIKRPAIILRRMTDSKIATERGPMPIIPIHKIVLLTLPSFWIRGSFNENKKFLKDWEGMTEAFDIPFCVYTILR